MQSEFFRRYSLLSIALLLSNPLLHSQTPPYHHYTIADGLASSTVFDLLQDDDGFLWIATLNGLSRFDGKRFTTFRISDGLNANTITSLLAGEKGELYIATYEKGINVFRDGKIHDFVSKVDGKNFVTSYVLKDRDKLYAYGRGGELKVIRDRPPAGQDSYTFSVRPTYINKLETLPDGTVIALTTSGLFTLTDDALTKMPVKGLMNTAVFSLCNRRDGSTLIGSRNRIFQLRDRAVVKTYPVRLFEDQNDIGALLSDRNDNIWFSIMNRGLFYIPNGSTKIIDVGKMMGLENTLVNRFLEDREGNIWISTYGKGVYCFNNLYLRSFTEADGMSSNNVYSILTERPDILLVGTFDGINILENGTFHRIQTGSHAYLTEYIYGMRRFQDHIYVCGGFGNQDVTGLSYKRLKFRLFAQSAFCKTSDGLFVFGGWLNAVSFQRDPERQTDDPPPFVLFGDSVQANRVNDIVEDTEGHIWIGTTLGLCKVSGFRGHRRSWRRSFYPDDPVLSSKILAISQVNEHSVWFAGERGIARYDLTHDTMTSYTTLLGHDVSTSTSVVSDSKGRIWIGTMRGLYLFDDTSMVYLNKQTGLPSDEVFSLSYESTENVLYIGTSNGISLLDVSLFESSPPHVPEVKINSIQAGDSVYTSFDQLVFDPEQNNVIVNFVAPSFASPASVTYAYRLTDKWVETDHDPLNLIPLQAGHYEIQFKARSLNTDWGRTASLTFTVKPRLVETIWFGLGILSALVLASLSVVAWTMKRRAERSRQQLELTERINELKHQALSAVMNPHFIFNSLNSVQYLINSRRNEEANEYIAMMARLIRKNLDTAGEGFILLSEEIERLTLYLDLEKLRLQDLFSYEIVTGPDIDAGSVMIPNMIIQPFVENTLWHGIVDSGRPGLVSVAFTFEEVEIDSIACTSLIVKITDNGIGLLAAKKRKKEDHTSKGIHIIEERLRLLSTKLQIPQPIVFEDLGASDGNAHGTEVIISLPPPLYKRVSSGSGSASSATVAEE